MNFSAWLTDAITVASVVGLDNHGKPTLGPKRRVAARVEVFRKFSRRPQGQEIVSSHKIYTAEPILPTDRIWLPDVDPTDASKAKVPADVFSVHDKPGRTALFEVNL